MSAREEQMKAWRDKTLRYIERTAHKDVLTNFYNWLKKGDSTRYNYIRFANAFLDDVNKPLANISLDDYTLFLSKYNEKNPVYQMNIYAGLLHFSKYLYKSGKSGSNPMADVEPPKEIERQSTTVKRDKNYLTKEELKIYLSNLHNGVGTEEAIKWQKRLAERDQFLIYLMLSTGARVSAISQMDLEDINSDDSGVYIVTTEKRGKIRKYFLSEDLEIMMRAYFDLRTDILNGKEESALFISKSGKRLSNREIDLIIRRYAKGIDKAISPHKLRATFGTLLYEETKDIYLVQQAMGHNSVTTTQLYVRGQKEKAQKQGANIMSGLINGSLG